MGLFSKFKDMQDNRKQRKIAKCAKLVKNPKAIKEDRQAALSFLGDLTETEAAVTALLPRFDYSLEHGINDSREKETAMEGILKHGDAALPYVIDHFKQSSRIAWPIKIIEKLADREQLTDIFLDALDYGDISFDQQRVDRNYDILCYLIDFQIPGMVDKLKHFLNDPDERVRFASVEVIVNQNDQGINQLLEPFLLDDSAENRRIRMTVIDAFIKNGWTVSDEKKFSDGPLVEGVFVTKKGKLERRNF